MIVYKSNNLVGKENTLASETIFQGRVFEVEKQSVMLPSGREAERELVKHNGGVCVLAIDEEENIYFVRQYRKAADQIMLELPAGKLEKGEDPLLAAQRELREETGITARDWRHLGIVYPTPGYCTEKLYLYLAKDLLINEADPDEGEYLEIIKLTWREAWEMIQSGAIVDAKTMLNLMWYKLL